MCESCENTKFLIEMTKHLIEMAEKSDEKTQYKKETVGIMLSVFQCPNLSVLLSLSNSTVMDSSSTTTPSVPSSCDCD
jgi:hypothetical protein